MGCLFKEKLSPMFVYWRKVFASFSLNKIPAPIIPNTCNASLVKMYYIQRLTHIHKVKSSKFVEEQIWTSYLICKLRLQSFNFPWSLSQSHLYQITKSLCQYESFHRSDAVAELFGENRTVLRKWVLPCLRENMQLSRSFRCYRLGANIDFIGVPSNEFRGHFY